MASWSNHKLPLDLTISRATITTQKAFGAISRICNFLFIYLWASKLHLPRSVRWILHICSVQQNWWMRFDFLHISHVNFTPSPQLQYPVNNVKTRTIKLCFKHYLDPKLHNCLLFILKRVHMGYWRAKHTNKHPQEVRTETFHCNWLPFSSPTKQRKDTDKT